MTDNVPAPNATGLDYTDEKLLKVIKDSVAHEATPEEFQFFVEYCKSTRLNPFKREVWFVKTKGYTNKKGYAVPAKVQIMTGINGYLAIANSHPQFDGMEEPVYEHGKDGNIIKCSVKVWRKDRRVASTGVAFFSEYFAGNDYKSTNWDTKPHHMIAKIAKAIALREAFPQELNGTHVEEEFDMEKNERGDYEAALERTRRELEAKEAEAAAKAANQIFFYDLKEMSEASAESAKSYLQKAGATWEQDRGVWASKKDLPKLVNFRVSFPEVEHAQG